MKKILKLSCSYNSTISQYGTRLHLGCDVPLSKKDKDFKFNASSYAIEREPFRARLHQKKAWCAKTDIKYKQYLQVNMGSLRHVSAIELQGAKWSFREFFVKTYLVSYSIDGVKWKFYKSKTKSGSSKLVNFIFCRF
jgi:hypothetical protein